MKKKWLAILLLVMIWVFTGCGDNSGSVKEESQQVRSQKTEESQVQEEAVNTIQVGSKYKVTDTMEELKDSVVENLGKNYWPDTLLTEEELAERVGISKNMYENFLAEYQHAEAGIDMMILIEAKEKEVTHVETLLNDYREMLLKIYERHPQNEAKVFASLIDVIDNYVCYVQLGADIAALEEEGADVMVDYCQQENERALDILEKRILNS